MITYSFSGTSKEIQLIVPGVDVASGITPGYPRMPETETIEEISDEGFGSN